MWRSSLLRSSLRLCSRCASHASARPLSDSGRGVTAGSVLGGWRLARRQQGDADDLALAADALAVDDVELGSLEGRRDLVLHHLHRGLAADDLFALLDAAG